MIDNNPETLFEAWYIYRDDKDKSLAERVPISLRIPSWVKVAYEMVDKRASNEFGYSSWRSLSALCATGHRFGVNELWSEYADKMNDIRDIREKVNLSHDLSDPYHVYPKSSINYKFTNTVLWSVRLYLKPYGRAIEMARILELPANFVNVFASIYSLIKNGRDDCEDIMKGANILFDDFGLVVDECVRNIKFSESRIRG